MKKYLASLSCSYRLRAELVALPLGFMILLSACSSAPSSLSIDMYNAETNQKLTCAARDQLGRVDKAILAATVESCARQLEARGFVRKN